MQYAALKELAIQISNQYFSGKKARIIGTGGFVNLFEQDGLFDNIRPDPNQKLPPAPRRGRKNVADLSMIRAYTPMPAGA